MTVMRPERASWGTLRDDYAPHQIRIVTVLFSRGSGLHVKCVCAADMLPDRPVDVTRRDLDDHWIIYASHFDPAKTIHDWAMTDYENCWEFMGLPERLFHRWLDGTLR